MAQDVPDNPYSTSAAKNAVIIGVTKGTPVTALYGILPKISQNIQNDGTDELGYVIADQGFGAVSIDGDMMAPRVIVTNPEQRTDKLSCRSLRWAPHRSRAA